VFALTVLVVLAALLGFGVGAAVNRAAGAYPWPPRQRSWSGRGDTPAPDGGSAPQRHDRGEMARVGLLERARSGAVRPPVVEVGTATLFALTALRFGWTAQLPAFLLLAGAGVLLTVVDLQHRLLPNRVVLPALGGGAVLLAVAAALDQAWPALLRGALGACVLFAGFLVLALISPRSLGMGDVKLAGLLGLYLGWLGWGTLVLGAAAGFVVQAVVAVGLLAARRIGLRGELPFGPAMLLGAALTVGWGHLLLG
jgi:leader peptidase (prepilin peptidase)/N-methyltransferase